MGFRMLEILHTLDTIRPNKRTVVWLVLLCTVLRVIQLVHIQWPHRASVRLNITPVYFLPSKAVFDNFDSQIYSYNDSDNGPVTSEAVSKSQCSARSYQQTKHFIMTKIEKTGSTTLYSILGRFLLRNNLNIASQSEDYHIHWTKQSLGKGWVIGPQKEEKAEAMICHATYNETAYNQYFVKDYRYIVTVRHPVTWIHSAVQFFSDNRFTRFHEPSTEKTILDDKLMFQGRDDLTGVRSFYHLAQLQWLGYDYMKYKNNITAISDYIAWLTPKIDVIVLNDQYDASLVVMRRKFCWSFADIFFVTKNIQRKKTRELSAAAVRRLLSEEVNLGELLLYEALNQTWWKQEEVNQPDFWDEVKYFRELNRNVSSICSMWSGDTKTDTITLPASKWHEPLVLRTPICKYILSSMKTMLSYVINYAKGKYKPELF